MWDMWVWLADPTQYPRKFSNFGRCANTRTFFPCKTCLHECEIDQINDPLIYFLPFESYHLRNRPCAGFVCGSVSFFSSNSLKLYAECKAPRAVIFQSPISWLHLLSVSYECFPLPKLFTLLTFGQPLDPFAPTDFLSQDRPPLYFWDIRYATNARAAN